MTLLLLRWLVYNSDVDIRGSPRSKRKGFFFSFFFPERWRINKVFAGEFLIHAVWWLFSPIIFLSQSIPFHSAVFFLISYVVFY
jgi:hypothetical protein